jgi:serine/threonine protein kinase
MSSTDSTRPRAPLVAGTKIGTYQVLALLGAGAMGEVYRARDTRLGREVALKFLPARDTHDENARDLVDREARIVASLNHPNVLALHDIGMQNGAMYIVTELVDGESLRGLTPPLRKSLHRGSDCRWPRSCPRCGRHASRPEARQRHGDPRWPGETT